jgi:hypothetical protein
MALRVETATPAGPCRYVDAVVRTQLGRLRWTGRGGVLDEDWLLGAEDPTGQGNGAHNGRGWPWEPADRCATGLLEPVIDGAGVRPPIKKAVARMVEDTGPLHPHRTEIVVTCCPAVSIPMISRPSRRGSTP